MSILPSPPHLPLSPEPAYAHYHSQRLANSDMKTLLASSWRVLEQPPPPTLREILEAYKARGDGDREMLLAMLNAKSSEDQRVASLATLHRTMLDMYQAPHVPAPPVIPLHGPDGHSQPYTHAHPFPSPPASYHHSPPASMSHHLHHDHPHYARHRTNSSSSVTDTRERSSLPSSSGLQTRKRRRTSRSPPPLRTRASPLQEAMSAHPHDLPLSPYSSASSAHSSGGSPRSRESMAINSLLLDSNMRDDDTPKRNTSSERSTTMPSRER
ncbi:hypothetical protein L226DRAFT_606977 [Lentinus tigrinus ALCF2SS1-7]|uniref:Uncharacterized protein n=1 Tax=Lentinus tigrinus ALCF2SS1-6 TaxID=1328759 RepID=A0A5C2SHD3_9APHY|nr:hypothetical protein L227DRAFT_651477 [Lentinus tigrinus ALCF2SS1-6]RPD81704.1 hypothetical protein L226DRAFT_606977 [Lentinus tigrinus ALCF2SS1-7]